MRRGNRSDIDFATERVWNRWEAGYRDFIVAFARLAAEIDAETPGLGTELRSVPPARFLA